MARAGMQGVLAGETRMVDVRLRSLDFALRGASGEPRDDINVGEGVRRAYFESLRMAELAGSRRLPGLGRGSGYGANPAV